MYQTAMGCLMVDAFLGAVHLTGMHYKPTDLNKYAKVLVAQLLNNPWRSAAFKARCTPMCDLNLYLRRQRLLASEYDGDDDDDDMHQRHNSYTVQAGGVRCLTYKQKWCVICNTKSSYFCATCGPDMPCCKVRDRLAQHKADPELDNRAIVPRGHGAAQSRAGSVTCCGSTRSGEAPSIDCALARCPLASRGQS